ncbi:MAG: DUF2490 domain-containing protein [Bacteroidetes bacterium]|nr:DUF2490 domain-containing protein [Bacteroidota bacterium]
MKSFSKLNSLCVVIAITIVFNFPRHAAAQTVNQFSGWAAVFSTTKLSSKFSLHLESQLRSGNELKDAQTFIFRPGIIYNFKGNQSLTIGYAIVAHHRSVDNVRGWGPEHRIWEQYILNRSLSLSDHFITIQNRFRLEQRFISTSVVKDDKLETSGYNFSSRFRYFVRTIIPVSPNTGRKFQRGVFFSLQDEIFVNIGDAYATNGKFFDQNRAYISLGYRFSPKYDAELGYMYQYIAGRGSVKTNNNILQLAAYLRL